MRSQDGKEFAGAYVQYDPAEPLMRTLEALEVTFQARSVKGDEPAKLKGRPGKKQDLPGDPQAGGQIARRRRRQGETRKQWHDFTKHIGARQACLVVAWFVLCASAGRAMVAGQNAVGILIAALSAVVTWHAVFCEGAAMRHVEHSLIKEAGSAADDPPGDPSSEPAKFEPQHYWKALWAVSDLSAAAAHRAMESATTLLNRHPLIVLDDLGPVASPSCAIRARAVGARPSTGSALSKSLW